MAICNLFKKLEKHTGNFLMFSQYIDDLTKMYTQPGQMRVTPTKFIALNIDYKTWFEKQSNDGFSYANELIPTYFQNYFENGCAVVKDYLSEKIKKTESNEIQAEGWTPNHAKNLFWNAMIDTNIAGNNGFIHVNKDGDDKYLINEVVYIGDINMQNYNSYDNIGYNEIYCHIPSEGKKIQFKSNVDYFDVTAEGKEPVTFTGMIKGYNEQIEGALSMNINNTYTYYFQKSNDALGNLSDEYITDLDDEQKFEFNTLVLLYDLSTNNYDGSEATVEYTNIPMGIYFSGIVDDEGKMTNSTIKYVTNDSIYGAGTSYGVRICNRFIANQNSDYYVDHTYDDLGDYQISNTELLSEVAETMTRLNDLIDKQHTDLKLVKDLLTEVRANRVNVPYIKEINGYNHWFVNGKYLGVKEPCISYTDDEINNQINRWEKELDL